MLILTPVSGAQSINPLTVSLPTEQGPNQIFVNVGSAQYTYKRLDQVLNINLSGQNLTLTAPTENQGLLPGPTFIPVSGVSVINILRCSRRKNQCYIKK